MEKFNCFELAGFSKEESANLIKLCDENRVPYEVILRMINTFKSWEEREGEE